MSHYTDRPPDASDLHLSPDTHDPRQPLFPSESAWSAMPHHFPVHAYHLVSSLAGAFPAHCPAIVSALTRADALNIRGHRYVDIPAFRDPSAAMKFISEKGRSIPEVDLDQSRLKSAYRLEMCFSAEHRPRHAADILSDHLVAWAYRIEEHSPMMEFSMRHYKAEGLQNVSVVGFDGWKMAGQPLVKDRRDNIWIEDRCDAAVYAMSSFTLQVPPPDAPREIHAMTWLIRANAVVAFWKQHCWEELRDIFFSRAMWDVFLAALQLRKLDSLRDNLQFISELVEPEVQAVVEMALVPNEPMPLTAQHIEAVADLAACWGLEVYSFMGKHFKGLDIDDKEVLFRVAQIVMHVRREERESVIGYMECNQWVFDIIDKWQAEEVHADCVNHGVAKVLMDVLSRQPEFEDLDVEPLSEQDIQDVAFVGHHSVQLGDYRKLKSLVRTAQGITARQWEDGKLEIGSEVEDLRALVRKRDKKKFKAFITGHGALIVTKNNMVAKARRLLSGMKSVAVGPIAIEAEYSCVEAIAHDNGGSAISSILHGDYGLDSAKWMLGCLHRGKVAVSRSSAVDTSFLPSTAVTADSNHSLTSMLPKELASKMCFLTDRKSIFWAPGNGLNVYKLSRRKGFYSMAESSNRLDSSRYYKCSVRIHADIG